MNKFPARQSIYSEAYTLIDEETIEFTKSINEFIRVKLAKGYNLLELETELSNCNEELVNKKQELNNLNKYTSELELKLNQIKALVQ